MKELCKISGENLTSNFICHNSNVFLQAVVHMMTALSCTCTLAGCGFRRYKSLCTIRPTYKHRNLDCGEISLGGIGGMLLLIDDAN